MEKTKKDIKSYTLEGLTTELTGMGKERFRATQIFKWLYKEDAASFDEMTNLSMNLRQELKNSFDIQRFKLIDLQQSQDGTCKFLFELQDGQKVETVLIPGDRNRLTLCVSSQVGCKLGCRFCRTGQGGFARDLTAGEIIEQVMASSREMKFERRITNIVFMGMGEPLLNYENTTEAIRILFTDNGPNYSPRKVTVSTAGIVPRMAELGKEFEVSLAISLHAVDDETRSMLMPINRKYPIAEVMEACRNYPLGTRRRITFEYALIDGVNDSDEEAYKLAKLVSSIKAKVNLLVFNPFEGCDFRPPTKEHVVRFHEILLSKSINSYVRQSRGTDILAACGQLRAKSLLKE